MHTFKRIGNILISILLSLSLSYLQLRLILSLSLEDIITRPFIDYNKQERSFFPFFLTRSILILVSILLSIVLIYLIRSKYFINNKYAKEGLKYSIFILLILFIYLLIGLLDAVFDLGIPHWYYF